MDCWRIEWKHAAKKELKRIDRVEIPRILAAIESLADQPRPAGCRKLVGSTAAYRIRIGDYRVVYTIERNRLVIEIVRVAHRSTVYRS
jgi:mRNA interferase RelE/StbE